MSAQQGETQELSSIKEEVGSSEVPPQMDPEEPWMFAMKMPDVLEGREPFDMAFIVSMRSRTTPQP